MRTLWQKQWFLGLPRLGIGHWRGTTFTHYWEKGVERHRAFAMPPNMPSEIFTVTQIPTIMATIMATFMMKKLTKVLLHLTAKMYGIRRKSWHTSALSGKIAFMINCCSPEEPYAIAPKRLVRLCARP